jgi:predicted DNA-binding transcriptional regulator AlpA
MSETGQEQLLRKKEVASKLACSVRSVERLVAAGELARVEVLGAVRYRASDVSRIMQKGTK